MIGMLAGFAISLGLTAWVLQPVLRGAASSTPAARACADCGKPLVAGSRFCSECGAAAPD
jgi:predicted amidophosphoribosyltransferase